MDQVFLYYSAILYPEFAWGDWVRGTFHRGETHFFQAAVVSILLYGCTTWTLTKRLERRLDGNYTRMLRAVLNKSWRQHPTRLQLYGHSSHLTKGMGTSWDVWNSVSITIEITDMWKKLIGGLCVSVYASACALLNAWIVCMWVSI